MIRVGFREITLSTVEGIDLSWTVLGAGRPERTYQTKIPMEQGLYLCLLLRI